MRPSLLLTGVLSAWAVLVCCTPAEVAAAERNASSSDTAGARNPADLASQVDESLLAETGARAEDLAPALGDEGYLRRLSLDLIGVPPSPNQISLFALDPAPEKRILAAERLLNDPRFGRNWARYWRDVIVYRRSDDRALLSSLKAEEYLTEALNAGTSWDEIATSVITATGDVREEGTTALIMAQMGQAEETAAEVSRIFMGIQIHCAQCHDHPTDSWKRRQFHELAAFFPRTAVRPRRDGDKFTFEVVSVERRFGFMAGGNNRRGSTEHYMPDLEDPASRGTLIQPKLFATDQQLGSGRSDKDRRQTLANWMTSAENPWFAKAFVNRMWSQLVGTGFYEPVDDMGPERSCNAPETLELLSREFAASGYNIKQLLLSIVATDAYQRSSRERGFGDGAPFASNRPQLLRADQLFDALTGALGLGEQSMRSLGGRGRGMGMMGMNRYGIGGLRFQFAQTFGYDPSTPQEELAGAIPQALMLMNSPVVNGLMEANSRFTSLGRLVAETDDDEEVTVELYLRCLSREPTDNELATCLEHIRSVGDRREAFEDVLWALINSTEFLYRR